MLQVQLPEEVSLLHLPGDRGPRPRLDHHPGQRHPHWHRQLPHQVIVLIVEFCIICSINLDVFQPRT